MKKMYRCFSFLPCLGRELKGECWRPTSIDKHWRVAVSPDVSPAKYHAIGRMARRQAAGGGAGGSAALVERESSSFERLCDSAIKGLEHAHGEESYLSFLSVNHTPAPTPISSPGGGANGRGRGRLAGAEFHSEGNVFAPQGVGEALKGYEVRRKRELEEQAVLQQGMRSLAGSIDSSM